MRGAYVWRRAVLKPGDRVAGKYRVERLLGEGGMGAVFVAENERLRKRVALKILRREIANVRGAAERFTREAIAASSAKHPGIIEIYDADVHEGLPWIAMELLEGESVADRMERGRIPLPEVLDVAIEALGALAHVHRAGIVHRDLKPDNLFLEKLPDGGRRVKILDFGIAASSDPELVRVTQTGMAIGTPAYLAPEQAAGQSDIDARADVYAMGVILFELITGRLPYEAGSLGEMVMRMYTVGPPSLATHAPHLPPSLCAIVDLCLVLDRDARVQSAETLRRELVSVRPMVRAVSMPPTHQSPIGAATPAGHPSFSGGRSEAPMAFAATMATPSSPVPVAPHVTPTGHPHWTPTGAGLPPSPPPSIAPVASVPPPAEVSSPHGWPGWTPPTPPEVPVATATPAQGLSPMVWALAGGVALLLMGVIVVAGAVVLSSLRAPPPAVAIAPQVAAQPAPPPIVLAQPVPMPVEVHSPAQIPEPTQPQAEPAPEPPAEPAPEPRTEPTPEPRAEPAARVRRPRATEPPEPAPAPTPAPVRAPAPAPREDEPQGLDRATILRVLGAHEARIDRCYFAAYPTPPAPRVPVQLELSVTASGQVTQASAQGGPPGLGTCIEGVLRSITFPSRPYGSRVRSSITLYDNR
jgi:serine/threonine-protein kinase